MQPARMPLHDRINNLCCQSIYGAFDAFPLLLSRLANSPHLMDLFALPQFTTTSLHFIMWQYTSTGTWKSRIVVHLSVFAFASLLSFDIHHSRYRHNSLVYIPLISISSYHLFGHAPQRIYLEGTIWEVKVNYIAWSEAAVNAVDFPKGIHVSIPTAYECARRFRPK